MRNNRLLLTILFLGVAGSCAAMEKILQGKNGSSPTRKKQCLFELRRWEYCCEKEIEGSKVLSWEKQADGWSIAPSCKDITTDQLNEFLNQTHKKSRTIFRLDVSGCSKIDFTRIHFYFLTSVRELDFTGVPVSIDDLQKLWQTLSGLKNLLVIRFSNPEVHDAFCRITPLVNSCAGLFLCQKKPKDSDEKASFLVHKLVKDNIFIYERKGLLGSECPRLPGIPLDLVVRNKMIPTEYLNAYLRTNEELRWWRDEIRFLDLFGCRNIDLDKVRWDLLPRLEKVDIGFFPSKKMELDAIFSLISGCKNLTTLAAFCGNQEEFSKIKFHVFRNHCHITCIQQLGNGGYMGPIRLIWATLNNLTRSPQEAE